MLNAEQRYQFSESSSRTIGIGNKRLILKCFIYSKSLRRTGYQLFIYEKYVHKEY